MGEREGLFRGKYKWIGRKLFGRRDGIDIHETVGE